MSEVLPPAAPETQPVGDLMYQQMMAERAAAEAAEAADAEAQRKFAAKAEREDARELGLPYMSPGYQSNLETAANAETAADFPDAMPEERRKAATRGFHTSHQDADAAFTSEKKSARNTLDEFNAKRNAVADELMANERDTHGERARTRAMQDSLAAREIQLEAEMVKHASRSDIVKNTIRENRRAELEAEAQRAAAEAAEHAAQAREDYINERGGIGRLPSIDREDAAVAKHKEQLEADVKAESERQAEEAKRHAEQDEANALAAKVEAAKEAARQAEIKEYQDHIGVGSGKRQAAPDSVRMPETEELVRPDGVATKDWLNMPAAAKRAAMEEASLNIPELPGSHHPAAPDTRPSRVDLSDEERERRRRAIADYRAQAKQQQQAAGLNPRSDADGNSQAPASVNAPIQNLDPTSDEMDQQWGDFYDQFQRISDGEQRNRLNRLSPEERQQYLRYANERFRRMTPQGSSNTPTSTPVPPVRVGATLPPIDIGSRSSQIREPQPPAPTPSDGARRNAYYGWRSGNWGEFGRDVASGWSRLSAPARRVGRLLMNREVTNQLDESDRREQEAADARRAAANHQ
jgi:hypothetical protein